MSCNSKLFFSDTDECVSSNGGCEHTCVNTYQSFYCVCRQGYTLKSDQKTCEGEHTIHLQNELFFLSQLTMNKTLLS